MLRPLVCGAVCAALLLPVTPAAASRSSAPKMADLLTRKALRKLDSKQSRKQTRKQFNAKLRPAVDGGPARLVRSFAAQFWKLSRKVAPEKRLGEVGVAFGDAHHENFAFVRIGGKTVYGLNDFDDSGRAPVDDDAAHYFTELALQYDEDLARKAIAQYVATVDDPDRAVTLEEPSEKKWEDRTERQLAETTRRKGFRYNKVRSLRPATADNRRNVEQAIDGDRRFAGKQIVDVGELIRTKGGSAGLRRFWVLLDEGGARSRIELKELGEPGVVRSGVDQEGDAARRIDEVKHAMWGGDTDGDWFVLEVDGVAYLARDLDSFDKINVDDLKGKQLERVLMAQASVLAGVHRAAWKGVDKGEIEKHLTARTEQLAGAYREAHGELAKKAKK